jgi:ABC-2 type transport system ATP-binding protein
VDAPAAARVRRSRRHVLLSSHLLHEVQATVDDLVVISHGSVVTAGRLDDPLAPSSLLVRTRDPQALHDALLTAGLGHSLNADRTRTVGNTGTSDLPLTAESFARIALEHQLVITEMRPSDVGGLEQLFLSLTTDQTMELSA